MLGELSKPHCERFTVLFRVQTDETNIALAEKMTYATERLVITHNKPWSVNHTNVGRILGFRRPRLARHYALEGRGEGGGRKDASREGKSVYTALFIPNRAWKPLRSTGS